ncbi:hypothetical protein [Streptomyces sp. NPDC008001]|uniref:hypothetical protein n=1 Tax=Streptomyces sp. NPDC008001 TaxID=3364804 RepID=UPI0036EF1F3A
MTSLLTCGALDTPLLSELALFVRTHRGRGPGLLWPEHASPDDWDRPPGDLAAGLALRLGCPAAELQGPGGSFTAPAALPAALPPAFPYELPYDLLVFQQAGSSGWRLHAPGRSAAAGGAAEGDGPELRLRAGEVLYVPGGYAAHVRQSRGARDYRLLLGWGSEGR